jgi:hypothetical protein
MRRDFGVIGISHGNVSFGVSGCATRGLMAQERSPGLPWRSVPGKAENWGQPLGGADFLIARHGGDFSVPIRKAVWRSQKRDYLRR